MVAPNKSVVRDSRQQHLPTNNGQTRNNNSRNPSNNKVANKPEEDSSNNFNQGHQKKCNKHNPKNNAKATLQANITKTPLPDTHQQNDQQPQEQRHSGNTIHNTTSNAVSENKQRTPMARLCKILARTTTTSTAATLPQHQRHKQLTATTTSQALGTVAAPPASRP